MRGLAYFFDLKRNTKEDWHPLMIILNNALFKYYHSGGSRRKHMKFTYHTSSCCKQEPQDDSSFRSVYYVIFHIDDYVRFKSQLKSPASLKTWSTQLESGEDNLPREFACLQNVLAHIINKDIIRVGGCSTARERWRRNGVLTKETMRRHPKIVLVDCRRSLLV